MTWPDKRDEVKGREEDNRRTEGRKNGRAGNDDKNEEEKDEGTS